VHGTECEGCRRLGSDLAFAQSIIVELQHIVRELRDELENERAAAAAWPTGEEAA